MEQTRLVSAIEALMNVFSGFFISLGVWVFVIVPLWELDMQVHENLIITSIFTVSSLLRSYVIRRFFNNGWNITALNIAKGVTQWQNYITTAPFRLGLYLSKRFSPKQ